MCMKNEEIIEEMVIERNVQKRTKDKYVLNLNKYSEFMGMTLQELLDEAEEEEELRIRMKKRKLKKRLINYRSYLFDNYRILSAKTYLSTVILFYNHFEIEIPNLPRINTKKSIRESKPLVYSDLLTKDIIRTALDKSNPLMRALILFSVSSGCANAEVCNLTVKDFIEATSNEFSNYHDSDDIYEVIELLKDREDIIPTFYFKRLKTDKYYYTFCSPEATHAILVYLNISERKLTPEDKIFNIHRVSVSRILSIINDEMGLGKRGTYNRLRTHQFRKFHASNLRKSGMSMDDINSIQGKAKSSVDESYFFDNPARLKEIYIDHLDAVTINWDVHTLDMKSAEFKLLEDELDNKRREYEDLKERILNIGKVINKSIDGDDLDVIDKYLRV